MKKLKISYAGYDSGIDDQGVKNLIFLVKI